MPRESGQQQPAPSTSVPAPPAAAAPAPPPDLPGQDPTAPLDLPVSLKQIKKGLERPPQTSHLLPSDKPTFRTEVEEAYPELKLESYWKRDNAVAPYARPFYNKEHHEFIEWANRDNPGKARILYPINSPLPMVAKALYNSLKQGIAESSLRRIREQIRAELAQIEAARASNSPADASNRDQAAADKPDPAKASGDKPKPGTVTVP